MRMDPLMLIRLMDDEGFRASKYKDTEGFWTIGYGHKLGAPKDPLHKLSPISVRYAYDLLLKDIDIAESALNQALPWALELNETRYGVLVNMTFNLGIAGVKKFRKFLKALKEGNYKEASEEMLKSKWAKQVKERAVRLARYMERGEIC